MNTVLAVSRTVLALLIIALYAAVVVAAVTGAAWLFAHAPALALPVTAMGLAVCLFALVVVNGVVIGIVKEIQGLP